MRTVELVARVAAAVSRELDLRRLGGVIVEQTAEFMRSRTALLFLYERDKHELCLIAERGLPSAMAEHLASVPITAPLVSALAARTRRLQLFHHTAELPADFAESRTVLASLGDSSVLSLPLLVDSKLLGVLTYTYAEPQPHDADREAAIRVLADVFAHALSNAQAHHREAELRQQLESVRTAALEVNASLELRPVLQRIVERARAMTGAKYAALATIDGIRGTLQNPWVFSGMTEDEMAAFERTPHLSDILARIAQKTNRLRLTDIRDDPHLRPILTALPALKAVLGVSIHQDSRVLGYICLGNGPNDPEFSDAHLQIVDLLAQHAVSAIDHANTHERLQHEMAERQKSEAALRESEARFRRLAENAPDIIARYILSPELAMEYVNPAVQQVLGYPPEAYLRDPYLVRRQLHPQDRPQFEAALRAPEQHREPIIARWLHADGHVIWAESRITGIYDEARRLMAVEGITRDITERKHSEAEIERLLEQLRYDRLWLKSVIDSSPVGIILVEDETGTRVIANREAEQLFGRRLSGDGGIDRYVDAVRHPDGTPFTKDELFAMRALQGEQVAGEEVVARRSDGLEIPVLVSASPIRDDQGRIAGAVVVYKDIAELKRLERLREEWTSVVAHDLRQPVSVITLHAQSLVTQITVPEMRAKIERILDSVRKLTRMIADLLDLSRLEAKKLELQRRPTDLGAIAHKVAEELGPAAEGRPIHVCCGESVPSIDADPDRLEQVLSNLVSNAIKYGYPKTPIDIEVDVHPHVLVVSVTNEGAGISQEELQSLFHRFRRTRTAKEQRLVGVGLGLYIAAGLIEAHGGRLAVESEPGRRTTFRFILPIRPQDVAPTGLADSWTSPPA